MKNTVWKYPLEVGGQTVEMPAGADLLYVDEQGGRPTIWARVDPNARTEGRRIIVAGTGHILPERLAHVGSCKCGPFVWHVFARATMPEPDRNVTPGGS